VRPGLTEHHVFQLACGGFLLFGTGYHRGGPNHAADPGERFDLATMRRDWERHGAELLAWWEGRAETLPLAGGDADPDLLDWLRGTGGPMWAEGLFGRPHRRDRAALAVPRGRDARPSPHRASSHSPAEAESEARRARGTGR
jgi:hypothetical protein